MKSIGVAVAATLTVAPAFAACFSIYDSGNALVLQSQDAPIDLSRSIAAEMAAKYPGGFLVMAERGADCALVDQRAARQGGRPSSGGDAGAGRALNSLARRQGVASDQGDDYLGATTVYTGSRALRDGPAGGYARPGRANVQPFLSPAPGSRRP